MYELIKDQINNLEQCAKRLSDNAFIPFDQANTDYAQFKKDILDGAELLDADGQVMDAIQFVNTLP
jgi:hypothetical protein